MSLYSSEYLFNTPKKQIGHPLICPGAPKKLKRTISPLASTYKVQKRVLNKNRGISKRLKDDSDIFQRASDFGWENNIFNPKSKNYLSKPN
ncbi:hypothetical protein AYI68_g303 [Smittium mucronatum]|uniref:Uncharacterized protein n=1 Tax=Smittium mucronatum TaxID=133383 RepID=A0A1R0H8Q5_9FUNG|nr:hypothetical protein AYI68_g303 [Smittium mucronatum]